MNEISVQNIVTGHGISISLTGMAIVFSGLLIITICITLLPHILELQQRAFNRKKIAAEKETKPEAIPVSAPVDVAQSTLDAPSANYDEENDIASVIGLVLQLEAERYFHWDNEAITMNRGSNQPSMWGKTAKMRPVPHRRNYAKV